MPAANAKVGKKIWIPIGSKKFQGMIKFKGSERQAEDFIMGTSQAEETDEDGETTEERVYEHEREKETAGLEDNLSSNSRKDPGTPDTIPLDNDSPQKEEIKLTPRENLKRNKYIKVSVNTFVKFYVQCCIPWYSSVKHNSGNKNFTYY